MTTNIHVRVAEPGVEPDQLDELTRLLREELLQLDVDSVEPMSASAPPGARAADGALIGALIVSLKPTVEALAALVSAVRKWLARGSPERKIKLQIGDDMIELVGTTAETQQRLTEEWIRLHAAG